MTALDDLAREVGTSGRTLRRAVDRGLIRAHRPSPKKITIDLAERQYVRTHWATISRLLDALRTEPNVQFAALYGSSARGTDLSGWSDLDLLVMLHSDSTGAAAEIEERLARRVGRPVDVQPLSQAANDPEFLLDALADARPLVDRGGHWQKLNRSTPRLRSDARRRADDRERRIAQNLARLRA